MLLLYLIIELAVATLADPFHKYPYVFLLDVGNEEIEKTNSEQIRLTIPGGSLALKYPATGDGDTIGHVRVSGIDFGTDLKASIVQGGPGYKYVVLVFMGNPGVTYDAVVTIQTVPNIDDSDQISNMDSSGTNQELDDDSPNNSAEDTSDSETKLVYSENKNAQKMQSSSNIYEYVSKVVADTQASEDDDDTQKLSDDEIKDTEDEVQDTKSDDNSDDNSDDENENNVSNDYDEDESSNGNNHVYSLNDNRYGKYEAFKPLIIGGVRFYPQAAVYMQGGYSKPTYDQENHNNEDDDDDNEINDKDTNNNDDADYGSPIDY